jgi:membrane protein CcdC involved in cytochrome C biogenesis
MFFLIALIVIRSLARTVLGESGSVSPAMLTDPLIAFALGMFTLTRLEMYLRARRLLEEARGRA